MQLELDLPPVKTVMYTTWGDMLRHWPKTTLCIVSNEFCERFSYYGMRISPYSAILHHLLGSIIADGYIGKFWTIFSVSILYACGQVILAIASVKNKESSIHPWMDLAGLIIIGFGTGGIKPCVSAFGGDQFEVGQVRDETWMSDYFLASLDCLVLNFFTCEFQERMLSLFFSMFYFSINAGSMISTFISPIFR
ncbi:hypothetical protein OSTOST_03844, partial [Ostertagia ostertagi]